jgi:GT2 family glycosyltransferase
LKNSTFHDFEVIVVDDGSPTNAHAAIEALTHEAGAALESLDERRGPATARNAGVRRATGAILMFLDSDTSVHHDTLERVVRKFRDCTNLSAVIGSYDMQPSAPGIVSRFRNLLHSYVHHRAKREAGTFWAGCGAVRRHQFEKLGGFDENFRQASIEDVEFGLRLRESGGSIALDPDIQVTHHKQWTLGSMIHTDLFARAIPWMSILHRHALPFDLNFKLVDRISALFVALTLLTVVLALMHGGGWRLIPVGMIAILGVLNWPLFRFFARATSWSHVIRFFPLLLVYLSTCIAGFITGTAIEEHRRDRRFWYTAGAFAIVLLAFQVSGGAYEAEFTGHPDEPAHFVSALVLYDYLTNIPRTNPIEWAAQYYLHYPKVAIGHWPPGYHFTECLWWLFFGPSRTTAMLLQWAIAMVAVTVLYRLTRESLPFAVSIAVVAFAIATPVFQKSFEQAMADAMCLLWSVLVMYATVRLIEKPDRTSVLMVSGFLLAAFFTKGTAICLLPVPAVALLASGKSLRVRASWLIAGAICLGAAGAWYVAAGDIRAWGGMSFDAPWPGVLIGHIAGWGFLAAAIFGLRRIPLALTAASVIFCTEVVSLIVRAMREDRHWIIVLPAIMVLTGIAVSRVSKPWLAAGLALPTVLMFPFARYTQTKSGFAELAHQVPRPSRMLVSSTATGEGAWVAAVALADDRRPASVVMRATKVLAEEGWNGEGYHLITPTPDSISRRLDELGIDVLILHTTEDEAPHQVLLSETIRQSSAWRSCAGAGNLVAYCRTQAPRFPRVPLHLQTHGWRFEERNLP